ncbi:7677_t:CDS:2 [Cetraspora pellucida]|uniref:7677_t:CDS:1 n=1 Tax=Cetraspora pellucida TaxID=1433469 RepID=A0A9N9FV97_9GLOM|nr:7677_t:CDS:2 [Cetraspora pellucida]
MSFVLDGTIYISALLMKCYELSLEIRKQLEYPALKHGGIRVVNE